MRVMIIAILVFLFAGFCGVGWAQNCCSPSVSQQGVLGETAALPQTLDLALHYEFLRSKGKYEGGDPVVDPEDTRSTWQRFVLSASYGLVPRLSVGAIAPYIQKEKTRTYGGSDEIRNCAEGVGDITFLVRYSPIGRTFVTYRELSFGLGVKAPTGPTNRRNFNCSLPRELQPGTGSWDLLGSVSFFQGFEQIDFVLGGTYVYTTEDDGYEFGNEFSFLGTANIHLHRRVDISAALSGIMRGHDYAAGKRIDVTGREQLWLVPGIHYKIIPGFLRLQSFFEVPVYQHFNGEQLGSDFNVRFAVAGTIPLGHGDEEEF